MFSKRIFQPTKNTLPTVLPQNFFPYARKALAPRMRLVWPITIELSHKVVFQICFHFQQEKNQIPCFFCKNISAKNRQFKTNILDEALTQKILYGSQIICNLNKCSTFTYSDSETSQCEINPFCFASKLHSILYNRFITILTGERGFQPFEVIHLIIPL